MKIIEAKQIYRTQIQSYREQKQLLNKKKKELEKKMELTEDGKTIFAREAAILELTLDKVDKKQTEYEKYMEKLNLQWLGIANLENAKQQADAAEEYYEDLAKVMEVARRLMEGDVVPASDEKKLMEYSMELYQAAKNMGALARKEKRKEYDSLWDEKEEGQAPEDPMDIADNSTAISGAPAVVDVAEVVESVELPE